MLGAHKKPREIPVAGRKRSTVRDTKRPEGLQVVQKSHGAGAPVAGNRYGPYMPGSDIRRGADSQQAHPIDLFADKLFVLVHKLARLLSVLICGESTTAGEEESRMRSKSFIFTI